MTTADRDVGASRRRRLATEAASRDLDGVIVYSWRRGALGWFTGYEPGFVTNHATLWVPAAGEPRLGVRFPFEATRARESSGMDVIAVGEPGALVPQDARRIGVIGGDMAIDELPWSVVDRLLGRGVLVEDLHDVVDTWRALKSPDEIDGLRAAARIGNACLTDLRHDRLVGNLDFEIAAEVELIARRMGATWCRCLLGIGDGAVVTEATGSSVGGGDPVCFEVTLVADGACTHVNATAAPGRVGDRRADDVCRATRRRLLAAMAPGAAVDDVVGAGDDELATAGLLAFKEYDFGHGLGRDTPEHPRLIRGTGLALLVDMVTAVHVAVRRPSGETCFVGGPVVITDEGAEELVADAVWAD